jgi:hypothetical protein
LRGNWEPIVTTDEFELGLAILEKRNAHRVVPRKHDYLLKGMIYIDLPDDKGLKKLTGSTSNAGRSGGGTAYYCIPRSEINLLCSDIDAQIPQELMRIQVNPSVLPTIRASYTKDVAEKLGHLRPDERFELQAALYHQLMMKKREQRASMLSAKYRRRFGTIFGLNGRIVAV